MNRSTGLLASWPIRMSSVDYRIGRYLFTLTLPFAIAHSTMTLDAIGGYFELELPPGNGELYPDGRRFQSARAAFLALLLGMRAATHLDALVQLRNNAGAAGDGGRSGAALSNRSAVRYRRGYPCSATMNGCWPSTTSALAKPLLARVFARFGGERVVVDHSQALFAPPPIVWRPSIRRANSSAFPMADT